MRKKDTLTKKEKTRMLEIIFVSTDLNAKVKRFEVAEMKSFRIYI